MSAPDQSHQTRDRFVLCSLPLATDPYAELYAHLVAILFEVGMWDKTWQDLSFKDMLIRLRDEHQFVNCVISHSVFAHVIILWKNEQPV